MWSWWARRSNEAAACNAGAALEVLARQRDEREDAARFVALAYGDRSSRTG
jgi:hypothetical protein